MKVWFLLLIIILLIITLRPTFVLGTKIHCSLTNISKRPHFFICTHKYEHMDLYSMMQQSQIWKKQTQIPSFFVVANYFHNHLLHMQNKICMNHVNFIYTIKNTVAKLVDHLQHFHVCIFLYEQSKNTGIYYVLKTFTGPVTLVNISSNAKPCEDHAAFPCLSNTCGKKFHVSYKNGNVLKKWVKESMNPHEFISNMNEMLYSNKNFVN